MARSIIEEARTHATTGCTRRLPSGAGRRHRLLLEDRQDLPPPYFQRWYATPATGDTPPGTVEVYIRGAGKHGDSSACCISTAPRLDIRNGWSPEGICRPTRCQGRRSGRCGRGCADREAPGQGCGYVALASGDRWTGVSGLEQTLGSRPRRGSPTVRARPVPTTRSGTVTTARQTARQARLSPHAARLSRPRRRAPAPDRRSGPPGPRAAGSAAGAPA